MDNKLQARVVIEGLYWHWYGKRFQLGELQDWQLKSILSTLRRTNKSFYGRTAEAWIIDIQYLVNARIGTTYINGTVKKKRVNEAVNHYFRKHFKTVKLK